jgi:hypothetical protein
MIQDGVKSIARRQPQKAPLSGYHFYMDRLRSEGDLYFLCSCGVNQRIEPQMPLLMKCHCEKYMAVVNKEDIP